MLHANQDLFGLEATRISANCGWWTLWDDNEIAADFVATDDLHDEALAYRLRQQSN